MNRKHGSLKPSWQAYCRALALGTSYEALSAAMIVRGGGRLPHATRTKIERKLTSGAINGEEYSRLMEQLETVRESYERGRFSAVDPCAESSGWAGIGEGCHKRREYKEG